MLISWKEEVDVTSALQSRYPESGFAHEALMYSGDEDFVGSLVPFITEGVKKNQPVFVVVGSAKIDMLREALGEDASAVTFADMAVVGRNPGRIIPAWKDFVERHARLDVPLRGVGEPISAERDRLELVECQLHEDLLNVAFAGGRQWSLLCPYDITALDPDVIDEAGHSHPYVRRGSQRVASNTYRGLDAQRALSDMPFAEPQHAYVMPFDKNPDALRELRAFVAKRARLAGFENGRIGDLVLSVNELATNSIHHGGGSGTLRTWTEDGSIVCEIADRGTIVDLPLAGREAPGPGQVGGRGLWLVNQLCDLMQLRVFPDGTVVRVHMRPT